MATTPKRSPTPARTTAEDPDTAAARKELKQTAISEKPDLSPAMATTNTDLDPTTNASGEAVVPELDAPDEATKELISSPKKKRAHDEVEESRAATTDTNTNGDVSPIGSNGSTSLNRTDRSEPEKKRPRDVSSELKTGPGTATTPKFKAGEGDNLNSDKPSENSDKNTTTTSAFNKSGMSIFATQASPFLQAGTGQTLSSFAKPPSGQSPFTFASPTDSIFKTKTESANGAVSPFGKITGSSSTFGGSAFGGAFGGGLGGSRLTLFGKPGESLKSGKPAKPFGAPASEGEEEEDEQEDSNAPENDKDDAKNPEAEEDRTAEADEKKKLKLQRVAVDDGEAGEATILQVRARLYNLDKASNSWKERGAGNLKIKVPIACATIDDVTGAPLPGHFDASALNDAEPKVVRLIMRQDSTHRVILNTAIIPTMKFQEKSSLKATYILFTAIEGEGAVSIQIKMNAANAKSFLKEIEKIQTEASDNTEAQIFQSKHT
ncbi:hypothetical protein F4861DRAFT_539856 [Xylaria intraflava]|nr:hypothetical protein F4861DRAFT_539856 [Xylaria intraflava]